MYSDPIAYFLTWSCYGTRLHGDSRGTVDRRHNAYDAPLLATNPVLVGRRTESLTHPPFVMNSDARAIVDSVVRAHCDYRKWLLHTVNVRTNHVHVIVSASAYTPKAVMEQFKAWGTRRLREAGLLGRDAPAWTEHGSTPYLWTEDDLREAIDYVANRQGADLD